MAPPVIPFARWRSGKLYLNLPIPADLRPRYLTASGKPRTHIVEALGTGDPSEGRRLARELQAFWELEFAKQRRGHVAELPSTIRKARELRSAMVEARANDNEPGIEAIEHRAADLAEKVEEEAGEVAALQVYALATQPERLTLLEALRKMDEVSDSTEGTKVKRRQHVAELLQFLKVEDCLPDFVTEARAVAYVDWLNTQPLGYSTKQDRLSGLQSVWRYLARKRQVPARASPWHDHELTKKKPGATAPEPGKRGWTTAEVLKLFQAPEGSSRSHYSRPLFLELYTLGFCTGMRLDEIVSLAPDALEEIPGGLLVKVTKSKTEAGVRSIPVVHPAAVSILKRRITLQTQPAESIFPECRPGGPDNRLSWHVQKALGRDRDRLGFESAVDFHSTRRSFMTILERAGASVVHSQRYVGHRVPSLMHSVYSDGASLDNLRKVAEVVQYPPEVEAVFSGAAAAMNPCRNDKKMSGGI